MKKNLPVIALFLALCAAALHSQDAQPAKSPLVILQSMKDANAKLIEQQKKTLDTLDDMQKQADQIKVLGKRT